MSKDDDRDIASVVRQALAERLGQERFELWFHSGIELEVRDGALCATATNLFALERLKSFRDELQAVARETLGDSAAVKFIVAAPPQKKPERKSKGSRPANPAPPSANGEAPAPAAETTANAEAAPAPALRIPSPLDTFVVGETNRLAHAAARSVPRRLGQVSPLLIHGPSGTGKSHLLDGICTTVRRTCRDRRAVTLSAEQFTSHFLDALKGGGLPMFRRKYRDVDLLLIDDVQFFAGKKATLVEFQHTLDTLARAGKQLVLASDRPPAELGALGSELVARMTGGLVVGMETPDEATRYGVLAQFAAALGMNIPEEVLRWLAVHLPGDARQLKGALHRLTLVSEAFAQPITLDLALRETRDLVAAASRAVHLVDIEKAICGIFGVTPEALHAEQRTKKLTMPRSLAMWLARKHTRSALAEIGEYFGRRSHSTVIAAQHNVDKWRASGETISLTGGSLLVDDAIRRVESALRLA